MSQASNNSSSSNYSSPSVDTNIAGPVVRRQGAVFEAVDSAMRAQQHGALVNTHRFETVRGELISSVKGGRPQNKSTGFEYPTSQQVGVSGTVRRPLLTPGVDRPGLQKAEPAEPCF